MPPERLSCQLTPKRKPDAREVGRASDACLDLATDYLKTRHYTEGGRAIQVPFRVSELCFGFGGADCENKSCS